MAAMRVFHNPRDVPAEFHGAVFAIGNFDGVHLGHQAVLGAARDHAEKQGLSFGVLSVVNAYVWGHASSFLLRRLVARTRRGHATSPTAPIK